MSPNDLSSPDRNAPEVMPYETQGEPLEANARRLAAGHQTVVVGQGKIDVDARLQQLASWLDEAHSQFATAQGDEMLSTYAGEWILDNFYVIQRTLRQIAEDLPDAYYEQLPKLLRGRFDRDNRDASEDPGSQPQLKPTTGAVNVDTAGTAGVPRVYALAQAYLHQEECQLDSIRLRRFLIAYQQATPLTMGELWALPIMLRLALLEELIQSARQLVQLPHDAAALAIPHIDGLQDEEVVVRAIPSLHALDSEDWLIFFEHVSLIHKTLCTDPAQIYSRMDFATRNRYRKVIETLAWAAGIDELFVAQLAVRLAQDAANAAPGQTMLATPSEPLPEQESIPADSIPRTHHVGYYLVDAGRAVLEAAIDYHPHGLELLRRWLLRWPTPIYLGSVTLLILWLETLAIWYAQLGGGNGLVLTVVVAVTLVPASAAALSLLNIFFTRLVPPRVLPKLDFSAGVPAAARTMIVVPALFTHQHDVDSLCQQLELHYLRSADSQGRGEAGDALGQPTITFALLTDFGDAPTEDMPEDQVLIEAATAAISALNTKYTGCPFYLFHRHRQWNAAENVWMGWERKRGKLHEFNSLLRDAKTTSYSVQVGNLAILPEVRYVITLDADTVLPSGEAQRLIGTLAHPLNRAHFDSVGKVAAGYTILQPRTEIKPTSSNQSLFARIFSGDAGFDLYSRAVSDLYQDLFGAGIFVGKGIYDVDAFERSVTGRVPENAILSHDLFEGIHGRVGLVTDVVLYEEYPSHFFAHALRLHRWVRGDWQLLPWLFARVPADDGAHGSKRIPNDLALIDRWKIFDNLRRSLLSPALLLLLVAGWTVLPGAAWGWTLAAVLAPSIPLLFGGVNALGGLIQGDDPLIVGLALRDQALRWVLFLAFLPYESLLLLDAILTTLVRLYIRRRRLLQWVTAARAARLWDRQMTVIATFSKMSSSFWFVMTFIFLLFAANPGAMPAAAPMLALWLVSGWIVHTVSFSDPVAPIPLSATQRQTMRLLARRTWLFYEQFVGPDDNWLPPDHFQEAPNGAVAHRTSPTNTGMYLLSTLAVYDLGYLGQLGLATRLEATLETLDRLERYRGHFWNWIDTRALAPLQPRYISTVDSGNLAGALIALRQGCLGLKDEQVWNWTRWQGLLDLLALLDEAVVGIVGKRPNALREYLVRLTDQVNEQREEPSSWPKLLDTLRDGVHQRINEQLMATLQEFLGRKGVGEALNTAKVGTCRVYSDLIRRHLEDMRRDVATLLPWLAFMQQPPALFLQSNVQPSVRESWRALHSILRPTVSLGAIAGLAAAAEPYLRILLAALDADGSDAEGIAAARTWTHQLRCALQEGNKGATPLLARIAEVARRAEALVTEMDFSFLYNEQRQVFHIGYNIDADKLDNNYYDLLASEARIASLVAIAKRDVPQSHWLHLGRPITQIENGERVLLSWSGTMFEYLMPSLLLRSHRGTLLDQSCRASVTHQIAIGRQHQKPWGISESGFYNFDAAFNYQYRAFGVPGLGFKRELGEDQVVAPYASILALSYSPQPVWQNLQALIALGLMGHYGMYESVDFTPSHLDRGQEYAIVRSYMAHHQGMILVALLNCLENERMVERFHGDPHIQSIELLLQEGLPIYAPLQFPHQEEGQHVVVKTSTVAPIHTWQPPVDTPMPLVHYLSNGEYSLLISNSGGGYSCCGTLQLTRWRADTTLDPWGNWLYLQEMNGPHTETLLGSATRQPLNSRPYHEEVIFHPHMAEFRRRENDVTLSLEITIAPADNVEIRRVTLTNETDQPRRLRLTSYAEVVLGSRADDERHQTFARHFIESEYSAETNALLFRRRPSTGQEVVHILVHALVVEPGQLLTRAYESDRARFLGRGNDARQPQALTGSGWLSCNAGATQDSIMALGQEIYLEPHATVRLALLTLTSKTREDALTLTKRYQRWMIIDRAFQHARTIAIEELREQGLVESRLETVQQLLSLLLYPHPIRRAAPELLAANYKGQSGLWAFGISGDHPILLIQVHEEAGGELLQEVLRAHRYWRRRGLRIDLVFLDRQRPHNGQSVQGLVQRTIHRMESDEWLNRGGGIFVLRHEQLGAEDCVLLQTAARVVLNAEAGSLSEQLAGMLVQPTPLPLFAPAFDNTSAASIAGEVQAERPTLARSTDLEFDDGYGGFSADGTEYVIYQQSGESTPAPCINVIANADFGCLVTESGGGYTWSINSGENRLTGWQNDLVSDPPAEVLYLRDEQTGEIWTPTPQPAPATAPFLVRHGAGYSVFEHQSHELKQMTRLFVPPDAPVKVVHLRLENMSAEGRRITATYYAELVLGVNHTQSSQFIVPEYEEQICALLFRNPYRMEFGNRVAFVAGSTEPHGVTTDRTEFLGRLGARSRPAALTRIGLSGRVQAGTDSCAALQLHIDLPPKEVKEVYFLVGQGANRQEAVALVACFKAAEIVARA